jgi:hypothetical protein
MNRQLALSVNASRPLILTLLLTLVLLFAGTPAYAEAPANDDFDGAAAVPTLPFATAVELEPAPNDRIAGATAVPAVRPYHDAVSFRLATRDLGDPYCGSGPTVWYTFTPSWDTRLALRASGSEAAVSVYTGEPGSLTQVVCQYLHIVPALEIEVVAGETYYIMLAAAWYYPGDVDFTLQPDNAYVYLPAIMKP